MHEAHELIEHGLVAATLELPFQSRQKSRLSATLSNGEAIGLFLPRGTVLRHGSLLKTTAGAVIQVRAAVEAVSTAASDDAHLLMRIAYHLGNRHVPLQIEPGFVRYQHDHVLDKMVVGLGARVQLESAPFEPEGGAYTGGHAHHHHHDNHSDHHRLDQGG